MEKIRLGRTNLWVTRSGFGALPIQRVTKDEAVRILRKAYDSGINFFDTARAYTDSEEKIGCALSDVRKNIIIATKTNASDPKKLLSDLETSLRNLKTDYIDIYQLHNPKKLPDPEEEEGLYQTLLEAKKKGLIRFIGITNHSLDRAMAAANSGKYDTIQFPLSSLSSDKDLELVKLCRENDIGVIAMKALSGGLITNARTTFAFLRQFDNVVPIWGIQREEELDEFLDMEKNPPVLDEEMWKLIQKDREELGGEFCRGCGYCLPCPVGINIPIDARMALLLTRSPYQPLLEDRVKENMEKIEMCKKCGHCTSNCPYELDTPSLLRKNLMFYREFYKSHKS